MARNAIANFRNNKRVQAVVNWAKRVSFPFMGGLPIYWVIMFFIRNIIRESISLRASSIAFNLFLSLFPSLIFLFTMLPYIPVEGLHKEILLFLSAIMPTSAFTTIDDVLKDIMATHSTRLLSVGIIAALYFASNGVYSLMQTFDKTDRRSYWIQKLISIALTLVLGILLITGLSVFLFSSYALEMLTYATKLDSNIYYYVLLITQWLMCFILLFGATTILYHHGDSRVTTAKQVIPGAILTSISVVFISIAYSYYVNKWANYSKLYGSLGAMIITMLWLYFNAMVIIIGHEFNRSLLHAKLAMVREKPELNQNEEPDSLQKLQESK
jgi:membrane protein